MQLTGFDVRHFLRQHWQREPLLIRQGFPGFSDLLTPEELAGLACETEIESRLVHTRGKQYRMRNGPFSESDFTSLPARNWTLLVQSVDQWLPSAKALLHSVPFIPSWRLDDLMISYATKGGGVGPHFDYYDVFLVQGLGSRHWKLGQHCSSRDEIISASGLKLLRNFQETDSVVLQTGDVLYVPPGVAHWGTADSNSMCYSIGFRAPSLEEMLIGYSEHLAFESNPDERYTDPPLKPDCIQPGEIDIQGINRARRQLSTLLKDGDKFIDWFGSIMTAGRHPELIAPEHPLPDLAQPGLRLVPSLASRIAWHHQENKLLLFVDGETLKLRFSKPLVKLAQQLSKHESFTVSSFMQHTASRELIQELLARGCLELA